MKLNLANDDIDVNARDPLHGAMLIWFSVSNGYAGVIMVSLEKETLDVDPGKEEIYPQSHCTINFSERRTSLYHYP